MLERDLIRERTQVGVAAARTCGLNGVDGIPEKMGRVLGRTAHVVCVGSLLRLRSAAYGDVLEVQYEQRQKKNLEHAD